MHASPPTAAAPHSAFLFCSSLILSKLLEAQAQFDSYVRETAGASQADEIAKLAEQKAKGNLSEAEFEQAKAKVLNG